MSGDYYQIPTVSFADLPNGTYEVTLIATAASNVATGLNDVPESKEAYPEVQRPEPIDPSVAETILENNKQVTQQLFADVQTWLQAEEEA